MTTPSTMTTSMITKATTMMTDVVVAPSLGGVMVGCMLLLTGTVPVLSGVLWTGGVSVAIIVPRVFGVVVSSGIDAMDRKYTI